MKKYKTIDFENDLLFWHYKGEVYCIGRYVRPTYRIEWTFPFFIFTIYFISRIQFFIPLFLPSLILHLFYDLSSSFLPLFLFRKWKASQGYQKHGISRCSNLTSPYVKNGQVNLVWVIGSQKTTKEKENPLLWPLGVPQKGKAAQICRVPKSVSYRLPVCWFNLCELLKANVSRLCGILLWCPWSRWLLKSFLPVFNRISWVQSNI